MALKYRDIRPGDLLTMGANQVMGCFIVSVLLSEHNLTYRTSIEYMVMWGSPKNFRIQSWKLMSPDAELLLYDRLFRDGHEVR